MNEAKNRQARRGALFAGEDYFGSVRPAIVAECVSLTADGALPFASFAAMRPVAPPAADVGLVDVVAALQDNYQKVFGILRVLGERPE